MLSIYLPNFDGKASACTQMYRIESRIEILLAHLLTFESEQIQLTSTPVKQFVGDTVKLQCLTNFQFNLLTKYAKSNNIIVAQPGVGATIGMILLAITKIDINKRGAQAVIVCANSISTYEIRDALKEVFRTYSGSIITGKFKF